MHRCMYLFWLFSLFGESLINNSSDSLSQQTRIFCLSRLFRSIPLSPRSLVKYPIHSHACVCVAHRSKFICRFVVLFAGNSYSFLRLFIRCLSSLLCVCYSLRTKILICCIFPERLTHRMSNLGCQMPSVLVSLIQLILSVMACETVYRVSVLMYGRRFPPKPSKRPVPAGMITPHPVLYAVRMAIAAFWYGLAALNWQWMSPAVSPFLLPFIMPGGGKSVSYVAMFVILAFVLVFNTCDPLFNAPPRPLRPRAWYVVP